MIIQPFGFNLKKTAGGGGGGTPTLTNSASGTSAIASTTASFGFTATAGRRLFLLFGADDYRTTNYVPSGWSLVTNGAQETYLGMYVYTKTAAGGETSVAYNINSAAPSCWVVAEFSNVGALDVSSGAATVTSSATVTTQSITPASGSKLLIAAFGGSSSDLNMSGVTSYSDSFIEVRNSFTTVETGTQDIVALAYKVITANGSDTAYCSALITVGGIVQSNATLIASYAAS